MFYRSKVSISVALLGAFLISGCATDKIPMSQDAFMEAMKTSEIKVDSLLDKGNQEEAVRILGDLAVARAFGSALRRARTRSRRVGARAFARRRAQRKSRQSRLRLVVL
mgnify:CR=1 FL=1